MSPIASSIAVVIVNFNTREHLRHCLASIHSGDADAIVVIDNVSTDGSQEMVRACFPHVTLIENRTNLGYGGAANVAIAQCTTDYVLLLNSDTRLAPNVARALQGYLDQHPQTALAGPRLHNVDGTLQASCYPEPTPVNLLLEESRVGQLVGYLPRLRDRYLRTWPHNAPRAVPWVLGAALAIRRAPFMDVLGFDPAFFMYFEETDLCRRLRDRGWQVDFAPVATIVHEGGASTRQRHAQMQRQLIHSTQLYYCRHFAPCQRYWYRALLMPIFVARVMRDVLRYAVAGHVAARMEAREALDVSLAMVRDALRAPYVV